MSTSINHAPGISGRSLVPGGTWTVDPEQSQIGFAVKEMWGLRTVRGTFDAYEGNLTVVGDAATGRLTIDAGSVRTGHPRRDRHLCSPAFFNVEQHPQILFTATGVAGSDENLTIAGDLAIGSSRVELQIPVSAEQAADGTLRLEGSVAVSRQAAGLNWNALGMIRGDALLHARLVLRATAPNPIA
jgi:polyisoprenoid-binding protein YceI